MEKGCNDFVDEIVGSDLGGVVLVVDEMVCPNLGGADLQKIY